MSSQTDAYGELCESVTEESPSPSEYTTPLRWLNKEEMEDFVQESLKDSQYDTLIAKLREIEDHTQGHIFEDFLKQFRRPLTVLAQSRHIPKVRVCTTVCEVALISSSVVHNGWSQSFDVYSSCHFEDELFNREYFVRAHIVYTWWIGTAIVSARQGIIRTSLERLQRSDHHLQ